MSKRQQAKNEALLRDLADLPENQRCADCGARNPGWASWNLGVFLCMRCAGIHRKIGTHISKVKSLSVDSWNSDQIYAMREMGNRKANALWDPNNERSRILGSYDGDDDIAVERYIRDKYEKGKFRRDASDYSQTPPFDEDYPTSSKSSGSRWFRRSKKTAAAPPDSDFYGSSSSRRRDDDDRKFSSSRKDKSRKTFEYDDDYEYEDKNSKLVDMGFSNRKRNLDALTKSNGDLLSAIEILTGDQDDGKKPALPRRPSEAPTQQNSQNASRQDTGAANSAPAPAFGATQTIYDQFGNAIGVMPAQQFQPPPGPPPQFPQQLFSQPTGASQQLFSQPTGASQPRPSQQIFSQPTGAPQQQHSQTLFSQPTGAPQQQQYSQVNGQQPIFAQPTGAPGFFRPQVPQQQQFQAQTATGGFGQQQQQFPGQNQSLAPQPTGFNAFQSGTQNVFNPAQGPFGQQRQTPQQSNYFNGSQVSPQQPNGPPNGSNVAHQQTSNGQAAPANSTHPQTDLLTSSGFLNSAFSGLSLQQNQPQQSPSQQLSPSELFLQKQRQSNALASQPTGFQPQQTGIPFPSQQPQVPQQQQQQGGQNQFQGPQLSNSSVQPSFTSMAQPQQASSQLQPVPQFQQFQGQPQQFQGQPQQFQGQPQQFQGQPQQQFQGQPQQFPGQQFSGQPAPAQQPMRTGLDKSTILSLYSHPDYYSSPVAMPVSGQQPGPPNPVQGGAPNGNGLSSVAKTNEDLSNLKPGARNPFLSKTSAPTSKAEVRFDDTGRVSPDAFGELSAWSGGNNGRRW